MTDRQTSTMALEQRLGRQFADPALLVEALTHASFANEHPDAGPPNERLEFLGDAVINLLAARLLFERFRGESEGELTPRRARVVRRAALAEMARELGLGSELRLGEGQKGSGEPPSRILADALEAVAGAVFLDGGFAAVDQCFAKILAKAIERATESEDFKTELQELCHHLGLAQPDYQVVEVSGPDHDRRYTCELKIGARTLARATASNKKTAEQACAHSAVGALSKP